MVGYVFEINESIADLTRAGYGRDVLILLFAPNGYKRFCRISPVVIW